MTHSQPSSKNGGGLGMMLQDFDKMSQFVYDSSLVPRPALFLLFFFNNTQERKTFQYMGVEDR